MALMMLKIDFDFQSLIPPLTQDEFEQLEQNILSANRCRDAILTWNGVIVDGHNRYAICQEHGIPFEVANIHFASKTDAMIWIAENQLGRRNLTDAARIELACRRVEMLREKVSPDEPVNVRKALAKSAGVSEGTIHNYMKIVGEGDPEMIRQVRAGEVTIGAAYKNLKMQTKVVREIYDDKDLRYKGSMFSYDNVMGHIDRIGKLFRFVDEAVLIARVDGVKGMCGVRKRLERQLEVVEGLMNL